MKTNKRVIVMLILMVLGVTTFVACNSEQEGVREFTIEELKEFDGVDGRLAYVAYKGVVYDVTGLDLWPEGDHFGAHKAGFDLTEFMKDAPHGEEILFDTADVVGKLVE